MSRSALGDARADRDASGSLRASRRLAVGIAAGGVLLSAADTYVIVLALPAIMGDVGIGLDQLQQATPIISGFLLGYVAVMPLLGRLSDLYGRRPLFLICLALFAAGSLVTASAHELNSVVAGRALQGIGGGGLVPVTLALVADRWPVRDRGIPLGVVGGVQELGSVVGPLYGALILSFSTWRTIFWLNLPLCAGLGVALAFALGSRRHPSRTARRIDWLGTVLAGVALVAGALAIAAPDALRNSDAVGVLYSPLGEVAWLTPLVILSLTAALAFCAWELRSAWGGALSVTRARVAAFTRPVDWIGSALAAAALALIVVSFSTSDPSRSALSGSALWLLPVAAVCVALFIWREQHAAAPLLDFGELRSAGAVGPLLVNLAVGAALMAALLDIPILARVTVFKDSQLGAALVLLRLLIAVPVGAVIGGWLSRRWGNRVVASAGLALTTAMFVLMSRWTAQTLSDPLGFTWLHPSDPVLLACGLGFGLAIAPVNASMLAAVRPAMHGVASALVVVARTVGMLVGISVLTAVGLRAFYAATATLPSPVTLCPRTPLQCDAYDTLVTKAVVTELGTVFAGAAVCAGVAAVLALLLLRTHERSGRVAYA
ncbi:MAG TPA: MFS transporter [Candidatus Acidoferrales bacterium]|nr:MFS transporter [Candidatus Acidoferrales bacterium]